MSRQELADACNAELTRMHAERGGGQRWAGLTDKIVGTLERGEIRWPNHDYRKALCTVLGVDERNLGLYIDRPATDGDRSVAAPRPMTSRSPSERPPGDVDSASIQLRLLVDGAEIVVPLSRRQLLQMGAGSVAEALALGQHRDMLYEVASRQVDQLAITSSAHMDEVLEHLREQWHSLVRTDNLLGPRFALAGVMNQIAVLEALRPSLRGDQRLAVIRLGAKYAESAAWLFEDTCNMGQARYWTTRAMEWAYEGDDLPMLAWTIFRRSQQAVATRDVADVIGLARAARRDEDRLATPTKAAIRVQEAFGHALDGAERTAQLLLDEAQAWAANDTAGDARGGHGSYCTTSYIETQRANCWLTTGKPKKAIALYEESLRALPAVYQRNHAGGLARLAAAYLADTQVEQAACVAHAALPVARSSGSLRILDELQDLGAQLTAHAALPDVAALLDDLRVGGGAL